MGWLRRLRDTFRPGSVDDAIDEELRFHLEQRRRGLERAGLPPAEAARVARERLGNVSRIKDRVHDVDALPSLDALRQDVAFASRTLLRSSLRNSCVEGVFSH
jgi:hypothetical protein